MTTHTTIPSILRAVRTAVTNVNERAQMRSLRDRDLDDMGVTRSQIPTSWQTELDNMHRVIGPRALG